MTIRTIRTGLMTALLLAAPIAAHAADLVRAPIYKAPAYTPPEPPLPALANWTGFYLGINAGYGWGSSDWSGPPTSTSPQGFLGGGTIGYNLQTGTWVWGLEGDFDYAAMNGSSDSCLGGGCTTKAKWFGTGRLRVGYAGWNNFLPYLTGGGAVGDISASSNFGSVDKWQFGWTVGGGLEYAMFSNWSVKAEYLYTDLGKVDCSACVPIGGNDVSFKANIVRAGLNYRF